MFNVIRNDKAEIVATLSTLEEANTFVKRKKRAKSFYSIVEEVEIKPTPTPKTKVVNRDVDMDKAVEITRANVHQFYKKAGFIKVVNSEGVVLHKGHTTNMGKVFSNYVNCAKYNQSYDFNLENGDKLYFEETDIFA